MERRTREILDQYNLNWGLEKKALFYDYEGQETLSNKMSLIRTDNGTELNVVGNAYVPMENHIMIEGALKASDNYGEIDVIKAGMFHKGKKVFIQFKIHGIEKIGEEKLVRYLTLINHNDGTGSFKFVVGNKVMSCENQFHYFNANAKLSMKHSKSLEEVIDNLDKYIDKALEEELKVLGRFHKFQSSFVTKELAQQMIDKIVLKDFRLREGKELGKALQKKEEMFWNAIKHETAEKGYNGFGLFNGFTYATNHFMSKDDGTGLLHGQKARINREAYEFLEKKLVVM